MSYEKRVIELASERHYIVPNWFYGVIKEADAAIAKRDEVIGRLREIAALTERLRAVEAERNEWKRKYETQCAGSMSAHERRIHLEADLSALRAELQRKDAALKEVLVGDSNISAWGRRIIEAALQPKEPPCKA